MAGGEGTRLRPLTSNAPKPMMPLVNEPMMEHIVRLLKRHGFDEIVVTVAFMANNIRSYFGDGSDFGVRMVYATEETPLGTAGSVRNAIDELDERFLVISGDVLTDIDLTAIVKEHDEKQALATIGLVRVENPLEFGIVITHDDGSIERFLEKPSWGQVFSDTINTGHLRARAGDLRLHRAGPVGRLLLRGVPGAARRRASRSSEPSPRATGRTSARSRATCRPTRTSSTARARRRAGLRDGRRRPRGGGGRDPPRRHRRGSGRDRRELPHRGRRAPRSLHGARHERPRARQRRPRAGRSCTTTPTSARGCASAAPRSAAPATSAAACVARRAWCSATSASWGSTRCWRAG